MLQNSPFNSVASPMGALVMAATDPSLNGSPDWSKNMDICDMINTARDNSDADRAAKCILRRLQESDAKIITLALTLSETCMKNCARFSKVVDQQFMDEMVGVTRGFKGKQNGLEALRMIQQWAKCLPARDGRSSAFHDTYKAMRNRGISFPESDEAPAVFQIPEQTDAVRPRVEVFSSLIEKDLATVFEKVRLCREMLPNSRGIDRDDALAEVIGFLEACRDRMVDLIDAGLQGTLGPNNNDMLVECLRANNAIFRTLEAEQVSSVLVCVGFLGVCSTDGGCLLTFPSWCVVRPPHPVDGRGRRLRRVGVRRDGQHARPRGRGHTQAAQQGRQGVAAAAQRPAEAAVVSPWLWRPVNGHVRQQRAGDARPLRGRVELVGLPRPPPARTPTRPTCRSRPSIHAANRRPTITPRRLLLPLPPLPPPRRNRTTR
jgi:hypothetical protein